MTDPATVPVRDAATVMLVRDGEGGPEVFMMRRTLNAAFVGGFYVFPGGAVDRSDSGPEVEAVCDGLTDAEASARLGVDRGGLTYWVTAIRECFEEAGVLLAHTADGRMADFSDPAVAERFEGERRAVHGGERRVEDLCAEHGLRLSTGDIQYVSHWITPVGEPRRFDTRFFVARAPEGQEPLHDDGETIASLWVRPADALSRREAGELAMIPPTIKNLEFLVPFSTADEILAAAAAIKDPPAIMPRLVLEDGKVVGIAMEGAGGEERMALS